MAQFLKNVEECAYNLILELNKNTNITGSVPLYQDDRVAIKDIFNMITAVSSSSFLAVGLTIPSPENSTVPAYFSNDLVQLYSMKSDDLGKYYHYSPNRTLVFVLWMTLWTLVSYHFGTLNFDHDNIDKAYAVVREFIKRDIKDLERMKLNTKDTSDEFFDDSSYYEDLNAFKVKWAKEKL